MADNGDAAVRAQETFETYLLALTFTLLGAAVQSAHPGVRLSVDIAEWTGWAGFAISGVCGLWRLEKRPKAYQWFALKHEREKMLSSLREARAKGSKIVAFLGSGTERSVEESIEAEGQNIREIDEQVDIVQKRQLPVYHVQRVTFLIGLGAILVARALPAALTWLHVK